MWRNVKLRLNLGASPECCFAPLVVTLPSRWRGEEFGVTNELVRGAFISNHRETVLEEGLGLFGNDEDAALLDEVVAEAYDERRRPSRRQASLGTSSI